MATRAKRMTAAVALAVLPIGAGVLLWRLVAGDPSTAVPRARMHAEGGGAETSGVGSTAASRATRDHDAMAPSSSASEQSPEATRAADVVDPVPALAATAMRELAHRGLARFVGLVVDPAGQPCPGAQLFLRGEAAGKSDERGAYEIELSRVVHGGGFQLAARAEGIGSTALVVGGPSRRIDLQLTRGATVHGRAIDWRGGAPVVDAEVELIAAAGLLDGSVAGNVPRHGYRSVTRCDGEGRFAFDHVPTVAGFWLRAIAPGHDNLMWHEFAAPVEGDVREVELDLRRRVAVRGRFAPWPPRSAADGATFTVRAIAERELTTTPDADGRFELALTEYAHWRLALEGGGARLFSLRFPVPPDSPPIDFGRIDLVEPSTVVGRIDLPPELLAFGFVVRGQARDGEERFEFEVPVAADGRFEIGPFVMDACDLLLAWSGDGGFGGRSAMGAWRGEVAVDRGARLDVGEIRPLGPVCAGRVVDLQGAPHVGAEVRCRRFDPKRPFAAFGVDARTDSAGRYVVHPGREPDAVTRIRAEFFGHAAESPPLTLGERSQVVADLVLGGGRRLVGRLLAADGTPVVGAKVLFEPTGRVETPGRVETTWFGELVVLTALDGSFEFAGLEPRAYQPVVATPDGFHFEPPPVAADATEVAWTVPPKEE